MQYAYWIILTIYTLITLATIVRILLEHRQPAITMAWVMVLAFLPIMGIILFFFFGQKTRKERKIWQRTLNKLTKRSMLEFVEQKNLFIEERYRTIINLFMNQNLSLPFKNNNVEIYTHGSNFFLALLKEIGKATKHIHIDAFIFSDDALGRLIADALINKAKEGVEVRIVYDDVGSWRAKSSFFLRMKKAGIEIYPFMPVRYPFLTSKVNYRNHRKMYIFDGKVGFIGGMNIALRYIKGTRKQAWRDTQVRIEGASVYGLQRAFFVDWFFVCHTLMTNHKYYPTISIPENDTLVQIVTSNPTSQWPEIEQGYVRILLDAEKYVYMETPYFLPTEPILFAMRTAAVSGVDVRLMIPFDTETKIVEWASRSYVVDTIRAGVKVFFYKAGFNHSKLLVTDDCLATIGSTNIDFRSFENNFESNAFFYNKDIARQIKDIFLQDQAQSSSIDDLRNRFRLPFIQRLWESVVRLLSPLM